eukprot:TRINITY_DN2955_c0_g2_i2.p1 TRINITY_DN2955_c0_g2~~TRINITY_DN2955_c0_g2_i2.p1  ORF type:complete len:711 (+),score=187.73 TRINITY_DN2955_c0_g2_i2:54-2186(+)
MIRRVLLFVAVLSCGAATAPMPQQLHIAYGNTTDSILVQWAVPTKQPKELPVPVLRYGLANVPPAQWTAVPPQHTIEGPGSYLNYRALITGLAPGAKYQYSTGWEGTEESQVVSHFTVTPRDDLSFVPRMVFFGDLGWTDNQILPLLQEECEAGAVDTVVMYGDFVYWDNGENENAFMRDVFRASANGSVPVMVCPGNGDYDGGDYTRYRQQWGMPNWEQTQSMYYSFNSGRAHIVAINTEFLEYGVPYPQKKAEMLAWLEADMKQANAEREQRPWIIVHYHRPSYSTGGADTAAYDVFEPLMYKYGADIVFAGHVHNQERTLPVFNKTLMAGPDASRPYADAKAPVYIVSGHPGCAEETDNFGRGFDAWTAWRSYMFGYTHVTVQDQNTLSLDFMSTNLGGAILDSVDLTKTKACNFGEYCTHTEAAVVKPQNDASSVAAAKLQKAWQAKNDPGASIPAAQLAALQDLYTSTNGHGWRHNTNWMNGKDPCDGSAPWYGVTCVKVTERTLQKLWTKVGVTAIQLPSNNLTGPIPPSLGTALADTIQLLDLSSNLLVGVLPQNLLRGLPYLHTLYLEPQTDDDEHRLRGTLPVDMGLSTGLPNLRYLGLSRNALTGDIPDSWGELQCHVVAASGNNQLYDPTLGGEVACLLWAVRNNFTGTVPTEYCDRTYGEIYVSGNPLMKCPGGSPPCVHLDYRVWPEGCQNTCKKCP